MKNDLFVTAGEVAQDLGVSKPFAYKLVRQMNEELEAKGFITIAGRVSRKYYEEELNQWVAYEKEQLAAVMREYGIEREKKGTHEKHLSVLDFEKKERVKEIAELEQSISDGKEILSDIQVQQLKAEQIRQEGEAIRQEVSELSETSDLLKEQAEALAEDKEKLLSDNEKLEKQQKNCNRRLRKWFSLRRSWNGTYMPMTRTRNGSCRSRGH